MLTDQYALWGGIEFRTSDSTYWMKALQWVESTNTTGLPDWRIGQRYAMACIFFATNSVSTDYTDSLMGSGFEGFTFNWLHKWLEHPSAGENECDFWGVVCNTDMAVVELNLKSNWMSGVFPNEVVILENSLEVLDLERNIMMSNYDEDELWFLIRLTNLRVLNLGKTGFRFSGLPPYIANLAKLTDLVLYSTLFFGPMDDTIFENMTALEYLDLGALSFDSPFPSTLQNLPNLTFVYLDYSEFTGNLTSLIGDGSGFPSLRELWVDDNNLEGSIPSAIGSISSLESLSMSECQLTGDMPTELGQLSSMRLMWFFGNQLSGNIPSEIGGMSNLELFKVHRNDLTGSMPSEICNQHIPLFILDVLTADCQDGEVTCQQGLCCTCCGDDC